MRPAGIASIVTADAFGPQCVIELIAATGRTIQITEFGISHDGPANNTDDPASWSARRHTTLGTGGTTTAPVALQDDLGTALDTTSRQNCTGGAAVGGTLHKLFVPIVSGVIWVAAPGREFSQVGSGTLSIGIGPIAALPTGIAANAWMVFEE
jgi:hypothetical protein